MSDKIKILTLSDHPFFPSGVAHQARIMCEHLLDTGDYEIVSLGGAVEHENYQPTKTDQYGDEWRIFPVDGYGDPDTVRSVLRSERPDILWFMTDPRFWGWLWNMEDEIRPHCPMVYYHVWDNYPVPKFNEDFYESTDAIATISKLTDDIVRQVAPEDIPVEYIPHTVDTRVFRSIPEDRVQEFKKESFPEELSDRFLFFFNGRNARRKQTGTLIYWFKQFLDEVGHDEASLLMHTNPKDENGQDLERIVDDFGLDDGQVIFSTEKVPQDTIALLYNMVDCTCLISDAEGFGLPILESKACETPVIVNKTGGLQDQITNGEEEFGIGLEPSSKTIVGSQKVPYIFEDRLSMDDTVNAFRKMFEMSEEERKAIGKKARNDVLNRFNQNDFNQAWDKLLKRVHEKHGSWPNQKYDRWVMRKVA